MKLLTKAIIEKFREVGWQNDVKDPLVICKFFNPVGCATWLVTEYNPEEEIFFGYVSLFNEEGMNEFDYFSLKELESIKLLGGALGIERDIYFEPCPLSEAKRKNHIV